MALATVAEIKALLQISVSTYDTLIALLITQAEGTFLNIRGVPFSRIYGDLTISSQIIDNVLNNGLEIVGQNMLVESADDNGVKARGFVSYINFEDYEFTISNAAGSTYANQDLILYPAGAQFALSKIVGYYLEKDNQTGYKSESIGNYSYTKEEIDSKSGIPKDIVGMIEQFQGMHK